MKAIITAPLKGLKLLLNLKHLITLIRINRKDKLNNSFKEAFLTAADMILTPPDKFQMLMNGIVTELNKFYIPIIGEDTIYKKGLSDIFCGSQPSSEFMEYYDLMDVREEPFESYLRSLYLSGDISKVTYDFRLPLVREKDHRFRKGEICSRIHLPDQEPQVITLTPINIGNKNWMDGVNALTRRFEEKYNRDN